MSATLVGEARPPQPLYTAVVAGRVALTRATVVLSWLRVALAMPPCPGRHPIWDTVSIAVVENALDDKAEIVSDLVAEHANGRAYIATDLLINSLTRREEYGIIPHEQTDDQTRLCCAGDEATCRRRFAQKGGYAN